jgi:hypothetical protein
LKDKYERKVKGVGNNLKFDYDSKMTIDDVELSPIPPAPPADPAGVVVPGNSNDPTTPHKDTNDLAGGVPWVSQSPSHRYSTRSLYQYGTDPDTMLKGYIEVNQKFANTINSLLLGINEKDNMEVVNPSATVESTVLTHRKGIPHSTVIKIDDVLTIAMKYEILDAFNKLELIKEDGEGKTAIFGYQFGITLLQVLVHL